MTAPPASCVMGRSSRQHKRNVSRERSTMRDIHGTPSTTVCTKAASQPRTSNYVAFYEKPFVKFDRILHSYLAYAPRGIRSFLKAIPVWIKDKLWMKAELQNELAFEGQIIFCEHHESHAASAFYPSPFQEAAFLTIDGVGEWTTTSYGVGLGQSRADSRRTAFPPFPWVALLRIHLLYRVSGQLGRIQTDGPCALRTSRNIRTSFCGS